jgi:hypothetical protein
LCIHAQTTGENRGTGHEDSVVHSFCLWASDGLRGLGDALGRMTEVLK